MAYTTQQDLIDRFGQAELDQVADTGAGAADVSRVARAIADADAEIDAALRGRYALPVAVVPDILVRIGCDLARESLYIDQPPEVVTDRAKVARQQLLQIAGGKLVLDIALEASAASSLGLVEVVSGRQRSPFKGFKV